MRYSILYAKNEHRNYQMSLNEIDCETDCLKGNKHISLNIVLFGRIILSFWTWLLHFVFHQSWKLCEKNVKSFLILNNKDRNVEFYIKLITKHLG